MGFDKKGLHKNFQIWDVFGLRLLGGSTCGVFILVFLLDFFEKKSIKMGFHSFLRRLVV